MRDYSFLNKIGRQLGNNCRGVPPWDPIVGLERLTPRPSCHDGVPTEGHPINSAHAESWALVCRLIPLRIADFVALTRYGGFG